MPPFWPVVRPPTALKTPPRRIIYNPGPSARARGSTASHDALGALQGPGGAREAPRRGEWLWLPGARVASLGAPVFGALVMSMLVGAYYLMAVPRAFSARRSLAGECSC